MNYTITITPTVNGWLTEKYPHNTGQKHQFVYATVEAIAADLLNVVNYEPAGQAETAPLIRTGLRDDHLPDCPCAKCISQRLGATHE